MNVSRMAGASALAWVLSLGASALPARAQVAVHGVALSSSDGAGVGGVLVVLDSGARVRTDASGAFTLPDVAPGLHRVALVAPGCQTTIASFRASAGGEAAFAFPISYDPRVVAEARRRSHEGQFISAAEIEKMHVRDLTDVLSRAFPGIIGGLATQPGQEPRLRSRGSVSMQGSVEPALEVDGSRMGPSGFNRLNDIPVADVAWIQILRGASGGWDVGTGGAGGLIRIQTKRGPEANAPFVDPERCTIPGWGG